MRGLDLIPAAAFVLAACAGDPQDQEAMNVAQRFRDQVERAGVAVASEPALDTSTGLSSSVAGFRIAFPKDIDQQKRIEESVPMVLAFATCPGVTVSYPGPEDIKPVGTPGNVTIKVTVPAAACEL